MYGVQVLHAFCPSQNVTYSNNDEDLIQESPSVSHQVHRGTDIVELPELGIVLPVERGRDPPEYVHNTDSVHRCT